MNLQEMMDMYYEDGQAILNEFDYGSLNDIDVTANINSSLLACDYYEYL